MQKPTFLVGRSSNYLAISMAMLDYPRVDASVNIQLVKNGDSSLERSHQSSEHANLKQQVSLQISQFKLQPQVIATFKLSLNWQSPWKLWKNQHQTACSKRRNWRWPSWRIESEASLWRSPQTSIFRRRHWAVFVGLPLGCAPPLLCGWTTPCFWAAQGSWEKPWYLATKSSLTCEVRPAVGMIRLSMHIIQSSMRTIDPFQTGISALQAQPFSGPPKAQMTGFTLGLHTVFNLLVRDFQT